MSETATLELLIQIRDELAGLNRTKAGLQGVKKEAESLGSIFRQGLGIGTGIQIATSAIALLKNTLSATAGEAFRLAGDIKDGSASLNISTQAYQVIKLELAAAGVEMGRFAMAIGQQTESLGEARDSASAAAGAYRTLALSTKELERMSPDERVLAVIRATQNLTDKTVAFQAAGQILGGKGIRPLVNALSEVAQNFNGAASSAQNAGKVMSEDTTEQLDRAGKAWSSFFKIMLPVQTGGLMAALLNPFENSVGAILARDAERARKRGATTTGGDIPTLGLEKTTAWREKELALMRAQTQVGIVQGDTLQNETQQRGNLVAALGKQLAIETDRLKLAKETALVGNENQGDRDKLIAQLEGTIAQIQQQKINAQIRDIGGWRERDFRFKTRNTEENINFLTPGGGVAAGMMDFLNGVGSTGQMVAATLQNSLGSAVGSLSNDIWEAQKGTQKWSEAFRNLGDIAGRAITELIVKLLVVQTIESALGWLGAFGKSPGTAAADFAVAGGGTFVTHGPTHFTVGDNPGGAELVQVTPLSGIGTTTVNGAALRMAGGGSALVAAGMNAAKAEGTTTVNQTINVSAGVAGAVRAELLGMLPEFRELAVDAVHEAHIRGKLRL